MAPAIVKKPGKQATLGYPHPPSPARACELRSLASLIAMFKILSFGRMFVSVNLLTFGRKFFSTPAGYKPPPEPKSTNKKEKEDIEMSIFSPMLKC
jgi:hypothetical protein